MILFKNRINNNWILLNFDNFWRENSNSNSNCNQCIGITINSLFFGKIIKILNFVQFSENWFSYSVLFKTLRHFSPFSPTMTRYLEIGFPKDHLCFIGLRFLLLKRRWSCWSCNFSTPNQLWRKFTNHLLDFRYLSSKCTMRKRSF